MMKDNSKDENNTWKKLSDLNEESFLKFVRTNGTLEIDLEESKNYYQKLLSLKRYYESNEIEILNTYKKSKLHWFTIYPTDWGNIFTEIESQAWNSIRDMGNIVLYPQYPVSNYFIDFANPGLKVGLELDGKKFHKIKKDKERDLNLKRLGWTIFRISGTEMYRTNYMALHEIDFREASEQEIREKLSYWLLNTGDGVIQAIKETYFKKFIEIDYEEELEEDNDEDLVLFKNVYQDLCKRTLDEHRLV